MIDIELFYSFTIFHILYLFIYFKNIIDPTQQMNPYKGWSFTKIKNLSY